MTALRHHLLRHRGFAALLVALALLTKVLIPAGYMVGASAAGSITVELCPGQAPTQLAMAGMAHHPDKPEHSGKEMPCAFSGLSAPSLAGADPLLLAIAVAFVIGTAFRAVPRRALPTAPNYLRPPKQGPPALQLL